MILEIFLFLSYEGWVCESVHKGFMKIHGIVIGTIFYETKTKISDFYEYESYLWRQWSERFEMWTEVLNPEDVIIRVGMCSSDCRVLH